MGSPDDLEFVVLRENHALERISFGSSSNTTFADASSIDTTTRYTPPLIAQGFPLQPISRTQSSTSLSTAVPTPDGGLLFVNSNQELMQLSPSGQDVTTETLRTSVVDPLIDAHITYSEPNQLWAIYNRATNNRYVHGILGDSVEGYEVTLLRWNNGLMEVALVADTLSGDDMVFEQLAPMWADVNGDGIDDLVTTIAASGNGAAMRVYFLGANAAGEVVNVLSTAESPFIGRGGRWLHQLAVGPLGPNGETELVEIRTPHIGGIVRYYRYNNDENKLNLVASTTNAVYTSHEISSRNIDQATVGDFNGDGIPELVVQNQRRNELAGLQRCQEGDVKQVWSVPLASPLQSNLAVSCQSDMTMDIYFSMKNQQVMRLSFGSSNDTTGQFVDPCSGAFGPHAEASIMLLVVILVTTRLFYM